MQAQCATRSAATRSVGQRAHATHARRTRTTCQCITLQCAQHCAQTARGVHCKHGTMLCTQSCHLSSFTALCPRGISLPLLRTHVPAWSRVGSLVWPCSWVGCFLPPCGSLSCVLLACRSTPWAHLRFSTDVVFTTPDLFCYLFFYLLLSVSDYLFSSCTGLDSLGSATSLCRSGDGRVCVGEYGHS